MWFILQNTFFNYLLQAEESVSKTQKTSVTQTEKKTTTTQQKQYRPVNLVNITLPSTVCHVTCKFFKNKINLVRPT